MTDPNTARIDLTFLSVVLVLSIWLAVDTERATRRMLFSRRVKISKRVIRYLRLSAWVAICGVIYWIIQDFVL
jgi:hypothetical protein